MSRNNKKFKGFSVRWRIFLSLFFVAMTILLILWGCQVLLINSFYQYVKTEDLKEATQRVIESIENDNSKAVLETIIQQDDINIRIKDMSDFANDVYSGGDGHISATHDIGDFEILRLYDLAIENGGEISQYYTYDKETQGFMSLAEGKGDYVLPVPNSEPPEFQPKEDRTDRREIGIQFFKGRPGAFFRNNRYVDDFLYAKVVKNKDGREIMVISDVQVTPLDSTIQILKVQLQATSVIALLITLVLSYMISKIISGPIEQINKSALLLARGKFDTKFSGKGYREIEELSDTLNYTAQELGKAQQFRNELLANVSHDLRTPLTMIGGYAEVMRDIPGENTPENVQVIIDETQRLTNFVNDMLDLSKLQSGMEELSFEKVNITLMLESIRQRYYSLIKHEGYTIDIKADSTAYVECDENKMSQAFYNLMDNAVNHTGEDKTVTINQIDMGNVIRIEITDSGEGIPQEKLPFIWDRYYKVDSNHKRAVVGSGIGLSIVKSIFEMHKLKYGVESTQNVGTTFWVELKKL